MTKKGILKCFIIISMTSLLISGCSLQNTQSNKEVPAAPAQTADFTADLDIDTSKVKPIKAGMTGVHSELTGSPLTYANPDLIKKTVDYQTLGVLRHLGTNSHVFNWKTGMMDEEKLGQFSYDDKQDMFTNQGRIMEAKGYERLEDLREFSQQTGTRLIIVLNVFGDTPEDAGDLAKFCYDNHIPVYYFDLGNEIFMYMAENTNSKTQQFKSGEDYLSRMREFDRQIKANYPGERTAASMSNTANKAIDEDFKYFPDPYWDAVAIHKFGGDGDTLDLAIKSANSTFLNWASQLKNNYAPRLPNPNTPFMIEEHSVELGGRLALTHYNGIVVSENTLRFSMNSNVEYVRSWRLVDGIANADEQLDAARQKLLDAYQRKAILDTNNFKYDFKGSVTGIPQNILDGALYFSNEAWETRITGGTTVPSTSVNIPALYAQAYRGTNGKNYVVLVNKSDKSHQVSIKMDGKNISSQLSKVTYSNSNPAAKGEVAALPNVEATGNPVFIPKYSITRVEWTRTNKPDAPPPSWVTHADVRNNQVVLRWLKSVNAAGYKVKYGTSKDNLTKVIDAGNVTSLTINGLKNGETYYFAVAAYNKTGESEYSNKVVQNGVFVNEVSAKLAAPETPVITDIHPEKSNRMVVEWKSVPGAAGYKLKYGMSPNTYTQEIDLGNHVGRIVDFLTNDQTYYFAVSAYNALGESGNSAEVNGKPTAGLPLAPYSLLIANEDKDSIKLTWSRTKAEKEVEYFEGASLKGWSEVAGQWSVVDHLNKSRETKVYRSSGDGKAISILNIQNSEQDMELEAIVEISQIGPKSEVGIISRFKDVNNYYKFAASNKGFQIVKVVDGAETVLKEVPYIMRTFPVTLQMVLKGDEITGFYNNKEIAAVKDSTFKSGNIGLYSNDLAAPFDSVRIKRDNAKLFNIYRSEKPYSGFTKIKTVDARETGFVDTGLEPGKQYYYRVTAENEAGESYGTSNTIRKN